MTLTTQTVHDMSGNYPRAPKPRRLHTRLRRRDFKSAAMPSSAGCSSAMAALELLARAARAAIVPCGVTAKVAKHGQLLAAFAKDASAHHRGCERRGEQPA